MKRYRIGVENMGGVEWTGGKSYLVNLLTALKSLEEPERPEIVLLGGEEPIRDHSGRQLNDEQLRFDHGASRSLQARITNRLHTYAQHKFKIESKRSRYLRKHDLDAVFYQGNIDSKSSIPQMGWIPDFQHVIMPDMFSENECRSRDNRFRDIGLFADKVILSSRDALKDFGNFQPEKKDKGAVLSFVAQVLPASYDISPEVVCTRYDLPEKFFYLPNQLWKHKNHLLVIRALGLLKSRHPEITVVSSGQATDPRHPEHVSKLLLETSLEGVRSQMRFLGMLPASDIVPVIRQSLAVLQPSLFEGWSTTVEEAKSVGKRVFLSDTGIHREQSPPGARYFNPHSPEELADLLRESYYTLCAGPDREMEAEARRQLPARTRSYAHCFLNIVREIANRRSN